jgi:hypothetical protein
MTDAMLAFREVRIDGPDFLSGQPLWWARLDLAAPLNAQNQKPLVRNHSIRLLLQRSQPRVTPIVDNGNVSESVPFLEPLLLSAAVTPYNFPGRTVAPTVSIGAARFTPVLPPRPLGGGGGNAAGGVGRAADANHYYSDLLVAPRSAWPPQTGFTTIPPNSDLFELAAPRLRVTRGRVRVGYPQSGDPSLQNVLSIDWLPQNPDYARIFGSLLIKKYNPSPNAFITFDLVPEGVEFDVMVPDPFWPDPVPIDPAKPALWRKLRLRLVTDAAAASDPGPGMAGLRLDLIGGVQEDLSDLNQGLSWLSRDLAANGGCLSVQFNTGGLPPLSWPLVRNPTQPNYFACDVRRPDDGGAATNTLPAVRLRQDSFAVRVITREDFGGGEPGVAELTGPMAALAPRAPGESLMLNVVSAAAVSSASKMPDVTLKWSKGACAPAVLPPTGIDISGFSGVIDAEPIAARLGDAWAASGAIAPDARPPYAFLALDRGWLQMPLPPAPPKGMSSVTPQTTQSAFDGFLRLTMDRRTSDHPPAIVDDPQSVGIGLVAAQSVSVTVSWAKPKDSSAARDIDVKITGATGTLDGLLWMGEASPSPTEILPPLDAGPAALTSLPISFGVAGPGNWQVTASGFNQTTAITISFKLPLFDGVTRPLLAWLPHGSLALVSSVAMTRTADNATRPSATRELVPAELIGSGFALQLAFGCIAAGLPSLGPLPPKSTAHGDGRWRWPWPPPNAAGPGPYPSSPEEGAGVALASLTLPGVEFTPSENAITPVTDMRVSLRFDLPLLDELFANTKTPEPAASASSQLVKPAPASGASSAAKPAAPALPPGAPPTALDPARLAGVWFANARRLARARTEVDRVLLKETPQAVELWHPFAGLQGAVVRGLVEPYVWNVAGFTFQTTPPDSAARPADTAALGAYTVGTSNPGTTHGWFFGSTALGGLTGAFAIDPVAGTLSPGTGGPGTIPISIDGFASSSFKVATSAHLQDARGLSLAVAPDLPPAAKFTSRAVIMRQWPAGAAPMTATSAALATLREVAKVKLGGQDLEFWFRDLPLTPLAAGGWEFADPAKIESAVGPDATAIDRDRLVNGLYEWRLYPKVPVDSSGMPVNQRGVYEFDLAGPLSARPLRLLEVELAPDGGVASFQVVVTVQFKSSEDDDDGSPFGAEDAYATGNLATLTFAMSGGALSLSEFARYHVAGTVNGSSRLTLTAKAAVNLGLANATQSTTWLSFNFVPGISAGAPDIAAADLKVRLFGQSYDLDTRNAGFAGDKLRGDFGAPAAIDGLTLGKLHLDWDLKNGPVLSIPDWTLAAPLRPDATGGPFAFRRGAEVATGRAFILNWLGLSISSDNVAEQVDHDQGVVNIDINAARLNSTAAPSPKLFRGFLLPSGTLRGKIAVVFQQQRASDTNSKYLVGSVYAEFAFNADSTSTMQRITAIRHRYVAGRTHTNTLTGHSRLLLDAAFGAADLSSISWPVGQVTVNLGGSPPDFNPDPNQIGDWNAVKLTVNAIQTPALVLEHHVRPRVCAHEFPLDSLGIEGEELVLQKPWRFRAVVDHSLMPAAAIGWAGATGDVAKTALQWTSLDEICLFDMIWLVRAATPPYSVDGSAATSDAYAFLARYHGTDPADMDDVRIAGVVRRALADAGFPTQRIMDILALPTPPVTQLPQSLVLTGAAVTEVVTHPADHDNPVASGVTMVPQWILLWAAPPNPSSDWLGNLAKCPQSDTQGRSYQIAPYDAAAGVARPLDGAPRYTFSAQDGTQRLIEGRLTKMVGGSSQMLIPVDQAILVDDPVIPAPGRPLFPRTLLAMKAVADAFGMALLKPNSQHALVSPSISAPLFTQGISCITVTQLPDKQRGTAAAPPPPSDARAGDAVRFSVTAWPADAPPSDPVPAGVTLIVADERAVRASVLPADLAATLVDPSSDALVADGQQRGDAAMRAFSLSATPRVVLLARIDDSYLTIHGNEGDAVSAVKLDDAIASAVASPPQVFWLPSDVQPAPVARSRLLRKPEDTLYASATLGWPRQSGRESDLAKSHVSLDAEEVRRSESLAWAGRARSLAWPAAAWRRAVDPTIHFDGHGNTVDGGYEYDAVAEVAASAFIATGQRIAFRRKTAANLRSPPDRLSVMAPPRARAPTVDAMSDAFANARVPVVARDPSEPPDPTVPPQPVAELDLNFRSGLAPMLPGPLEITVTGQRPGVMLTQHEGLLLTSFVRPFDPDFSRFGRPASRGPLTVRQVRAPRSSALPETPDLTVRRKTFIAADEKDAAGTTLKPFKLVAGPAAVIRYDRDEGPDSPHGIVLTFADPVGGRLAADWSGKIRLIATVSDSSPVSAAVAMARVGILPASDPDALLPRAELQVGDTVITFDRMVYGGAIDDKETPSDDSNSKRRLIDLILSSDKLKASQLMVAAALLDASADTPVCLTFRGGTPYNAAKPDPAPPAFNTVTLNAGPPRELPSGPPPVLTFDLPHIPSRQRWLPIDTMTLAFGDPAYDRELGSPTTSNQVGIDNEPHVLAVDRADYDLSATIYFAYWKRPNPPLAADHDNPAKDLNLPQAPNEAWSLRVQLIPRDGSPTRQLQIAAVRLVGTSDDPRYKVMGCQAYAIPLAALREPVDPKTPNADVPAQIVAGDRLQISVAKESDRKIALSLNVGVVAEPVIPPPAATYGLATLGPATAYCIPVRTALFATAPLPQAIEFPDLLNDLMAGHVRRRGLFLWPVKSALPAPGGARNATAPFAFLVKVDRTGGGQLPDSKTDFRPCEPVGA